MKLAKIIMIICVVLLIILAETTRMNILRRSRIGLPVPEYESQVSGFLESLSFTPVGLGIAIATLFFPRCVLHWFATLLRRERSVDSPLEVISHRPSRLFFIFATLVALWTM